MQNETMKRVPRSLVEPAAKLLVQKVPNELSFTSMLTARETDLAQARTMVGRFYTTYSLVFAICIALLVLIAIVLRNARQTLIAVGATLLITGLLLFIPWLGSGSIAENVVSGYKGVAAASVQAIGLAFIKSFFAVFVLAPLVLTLGGITAFVAGRYVKKKPSA
jgi:NADH:ubiquinone oxidoreductase subunit 6 (subunit J)